MIWLTIATILFLVLSLWRYSWALFFLCFLLPTYQIRFNLWGLPSTWLEIMTLIFVLVYVVRMIVNKRWIKLNQWHWLILAWCLIGLWAVFVSPDKWGALGHWRAYFIEPALLVFILFDLIKNQNGQKVKNTITWGLIFSGAVCAVCAILQKWLGGGVMSTEIWGAAKVWRATGPFPQPNFLGLYLAPIIILMVGQLVQQFFIRGKNSFYKTLVIIFLLLVIIFSGLAIFLARSEGAILGVFWGLIFLGLVNRSTRLITIILISIIGIFLLSWPLSQYYLEKKIFFSGLSEQLRLNIWRGSVSLIKDNLFFGAGLRGYQFLIKNYQTPYYYPTTGQLISTETHPYPHSLFLAIWSELGILGLIFFWVLIIRFFIQGFKLAKLEIRSWRPGVVIMAAIIVILVCGLADTPYFKNDLAILFWLIIGLI